MRCERAGSASDPVPNSLHRERQEAEEVEARMQEMMSGKRGPVTGDDKKHLGDQIYVQNVSASSLVS